MKRPVTKRRMKHRQVGLAASFFALLVVSIGHSAHALTNSISVAPAFMRLSLSAAHPLDEQTVSLRNDFEVPVELTASINAVDVQSGKLIPKQDPDPVLGKSVYLSMTDFTLAPKQSINLKILFQNSDQLPPGGHYAALLIRQVGVSTKGVGLQPVINVGIYVIKEDGAKRQLRLDPVAIPSVLMALPKNIKATFVNDGNVTLIPRGVTTLSDGPNIVAKSVLNDASLPVFLGQKLTLQSQLNHYKTLWLPGRYKFEVRYRYDGQDEQSVYSRWVWIIPLRFIVMSSLIVAICVVFRRKIKSQIKKLVLRFRRAKKPSKQPGKSMDIIVKTTGKTPPKA